LLLFGAGAVLGLAVVVGEVWPLARVASGLMALAIAALPIAVVADLRRRFAAPPPAARAPARPRRQAARPRPRARRTAARR